MTKQYATYELETGLKAQGFDYIIGVDECARGTLWGSVVASAVYIPIDSVGVLLNKVHDSKQLSPKKRDELSELIRDNCRYGIGEIEPAVVDEINILRATEQAMALAISKLQIESEVNYDCVLIDGTVKLPMLKCPQYQVVKGDSKVLSIAAASIVAKTFRDNKILDMPDIDWYNLWDIANNKGYGTKKHRDAIKLYGLSDLHRKTFGICKNYV